MVKLKEGVWSVPFSDPVTAKKFIEVMKYPIPLYLADSVLYTLMGADALFDQLDRMKQRFPKNYDVRETVAEYVLYLMRLDKKNSVESMYKQFHLKSYQKVKQVCLSIKRNLMTESTVPNRNSCLMLEVDIKSWPVIQDLILTETLYEPYSPDYGRELKPHITVFYGKTKYDLEIMREARPLKFFPTIKGVNYFSTPEYKVLHFEINCPDLVNFHYYIRDKYKIKVTHDEYKPHITIAYIAEWVKPDTSLFSKYVNKKLKIKGYDYNIPIDENSYTHLIYPTN